MTSENSSRTVERTSTRIAIIGRYGGFRKMLSFGMTCLVYHATTAFCRRNFNYKNDALGKTVGQMVGAARSARQNIVEGSSRAGTSKETELRLLDVARGSLEELAGDYEAFIADADEDIWSDQDPRCRKVRAIEFDPFQCEGDVRHAFNRHLRAMRQRFAPELESEDPIHAANAILVAIDRANALLHRQIEKTGEEFRSQGGFTERLSRARLEARDAAESEDAPICPICNSPMRKMVARKGVNAGKSFWSCRNYPNCKGTRRC